MSELQQFQKDFKFTPEWCFYYDNVALDNAKMYHNAQIIFRIMMNQNNNFSRNAVAAIVGNMEAESTINPGRKQVGGPAVGLVQWDPPTNYTNYADDTGIYGWYDGYGQMDWLNTVTVPFGQWIPTTIYNQTWEQFKRSGTTPEYLAKAFLHNFERPADAGPGVENYRAALARKWYDTSIEDDWQPGIPEQGNTRLPVWLLTLILRRIK